MDLLRLASTFCLLMLSCGDVERNPGPPPELAPRSEVLRRFTRCIQSELVKLVYTAKNQGLPTHLYERDPPGWNKFDIDIKFENICNIQRGGSQTFDKLVKLVKQEVRNISKEILDVIKCYENLRDSKRNSEETKKWKIALETYVSQNKSMKNKQAVIDNLDDNLVIGVLQKAAEKAKEGIIGSTLEGVNNIINAIQQLFDVMEDNTNKMVETSKSAGEKRQATETATKIQQIKTKKRLSDCQYKGTDVKGKKKSKRISNKGAIITDQDWNYQTLQQSEPFMQIADPGSSYKENAQEDHCNMAVTIAPDSEPSFPECLSNIVPETPPQHMYKPDSLPSPQPCYGVTEDSLNIEFSEIDATPILTDQETFSLMNHEFGIDYNWDTSSIGTSSPEHVSAFSGVDDGGSTGNILQGCIPSVVLDVVTTPK